MSREFHSSVVFKLGKSGHFLHIQHFFGQQYLEKKGAQFQRANFQREHLYITLEVQVNIQFGPFHQSRLKNEQEDLGY